MKKKRHTSEQVIQILRKADGEKTVEEVCRESNISSESVVVIFVPKITSSVTTQ